MHRLDQVFIEAGGEGLLSVFVLPVSGESDQVELGHLLMLASFSRDLVPVHFGQADVDQAHLRMITKDRFQTLLTVFGDRDLMAIQFQQAFQHPATVRIVFHQQDFHLLFDGRRGARPAAWQRPAAG